MTSAIYSMGKIAALKALGIKAAASFTSTILPKGVDPYGEALHLSKLKQLSTNAARNTMPAGVRTETPALSYLSMAMGRPPKATITPEADFTNRMLQRQAVPDILQMARK